MAVPVDGGIWSWWSPNGAELFYLLGTKMMTVPVQLDPTFRPGIPQTLFDGDDAERFDLLPNGDVGLTTLADADLRELEIVVNGSTELAELVPAE